MEYVSRLIFEGASIQIGEWRCHPDSSLWREENIAGHKPMVVFPRSAVQIQHAGRELFVTSPNQVVFYNKDQIYRRGLSSRQGDICEYVYIEPAVVAEIQSSINARRGDDIHAPFSRSQGPCHTQAFLMQRFICRLVARQPTESLFVEESFLSILPKLLFDCERHAAAPKPAKSKTVALHRLQVETVKEYLGQKMATEIALSEVATACESSVFHISRVFKEHVGSSIFQFLISLRLRSTFELIIDSNTPLSRIALETGFSSQSHMSNLFKREFGVTPNDVRKNKPTELIRLIRNERAFGNLPR